MDPVAAVLERARSALTWEADYEDCAAALAEYFRWRISGGFEPQVAGSAGDAVALGLLDVLGRTANQLGERT